MTEVLEDWTSLPTFEPMGSSVSWGVFDGVHAGHRKIIETLVGRARKEDLPSVVLTFDPHPRSVVGSEAPRSIYSLDTRLSFLSELGPDYVGVIPFSESFANQTPEQFYESVLRSSLSAKVVVLGKGAKFGRDREGDLDRLRELGRPEGMDVVACDYAEVGGKRVSSSRIRTAITEGRLEKASEMLKRPVRVSGTVVRGEGRGHEIGFPTANLDLDHDVYPPRGIYGGVVPLQDSRYPAVASIGIRPTFEDEKREVVEIHLLNFEGNLYDQQLVFKFHCYLRDEEEYEEVDELIEQIEQDIQQYRQHPSFPDS